MCSGCDDMGSSAVGREKGRILVGMRPFGWFSGGSVFLPDAVKGSGLHDAGIGGDFDERLAEGIQSRARRFYEVGQR